MKNTKTILARYADLSKAVSEAEQSGNVIEEQKAMNRFWAFVNKYLYGVDMALIRQADEEHGLEFTAFC